MRPPPRDDPHEGAASEGGGRFARDAAKPTLSARTCSPALPTRGWKGGDTTGANASPCPLKARGKPERKRRPRCARTGSQRGVRKDCLGRLAGRGRKLGKPSGRFWCRIQREISRPKINHPRAPSPKFLLRDHPHEAPDTNSVRPLQKAPGKDARSHTRPGPPPK